MQTRSRSKIETNIAIDEFKQDRDKPFPEPEEEEARQKILYLLNNASLKKSKLPIEWILVWLLTSVLPVIGWDGSTGQFCDRFACAMQRNKMPLHLFWNSLIQSLIVFAIVHKCIAIWRIPVHFTELVYRFIFMILFGSVLFYVLAVLFGISFVADASFTMTWALFITTRTVLPIGMIIGFRRGAWHALLMDELPQPTPPLASVLIWPMTGAIVLAWASSIVVPLDWERAWQKWPIPATYGTTIGHCLGLILLLFT